MVNGGRFFVLIAEYTKNLAWLGGFLHRRIHLRNPDELIRTGNQKYAELVSCYNETPMLRAGTRFVGTKKAMGI